MNARDIWAKFNGVTLKNLVAVGTYKMINSNAKVEILAMIKRLFLFLKLSKIL